MNKPSRGRRSKVDLLPSEIKKQLNKMLRDGRLQQQEILSIVNQAIDEAGLPDDTKLSKTGLNRYATRMEEAGAKIREMREVSKAWVAELGDEPSSDVGKLLQEVVRTMAVETTMHMGKSDEPVPPKALGQLALAIQRVEQAAMVSHKREKELFKEFAAKAAEVAETVARSQGLTKDAVSAIKAEILGIEP